MRIPETLKKQYPIGTLMDNFKREILRHEDRLEILSVCEYCGAEFIGSQFDNTLEPQEREHRKICPGKSFVATLR